MSISKIYKDFLTEGIIKRSLRNGVVPTKADIDEALEEFTNETNNLSEPLTRRSIYQLENREESSATKFNDTTSAVLNDLSVCYRAVIDQASSVTTAYDSILSELKSVEKRIGILEDRANNLLLTARNIEGYTDYISDSFTNKDDIDIENSSVFVDSTTGTVSLSPLTHSRIDVNLAETDIQFNVITRTQLKSSTVIGLSQRA